MWSFWRSPCINSSRRRSGVSSRICSDSYRWSPSLSTVLVFSFEKFPSKTLSSVSFFSSPPSSCSFAFLSSHSLSFSPTLLHILYCSPPAFSLSYPCSFFSVSFTLSSSLLLFLLGWEEVTELFLDPSGIERWSCLSCNPFFIRPQTVATYRLCFATPISLVWQEWHIHWRSSDHLRDFLC